jgi:hypothetical protein
MIEKVIGFCFIGFGIFGFIFNRKICQSLCYTCSSQQLSPCFFLFLFVGIIFVISGYDLVTIKKRKK